MKFKVKTLSIFEVYSLFKENRLNLKPYYQRNDVWTRKDQEHLIDSIEKNYPLPSFFTFQRTKNKIEIVDGKQRLTTIFQFLDGQITNSEKKYFQEIEKGKFKNYKLIFSEIYDASDQSIEEFYVVVNRKGKHLNDPEIFKAAYAKTPFFKLVNGLLDYQNLMNLNLFTTATKKRQNDRNYLAELVAFLLLGLQEKKGAVEKIYAGEIIIEEHQFENAETKFKKIIDKIQMLNEIHPISNTRYKQKNDFYTLFTFIEENLEESDVLLIHQYGILKFLSDKKYISPSIENCDSLKQYALDCVSQSNSKKARKNRLLFFNSLLRNKEKEIRNNKILADISEFLHRNSESFSFKEIENYYLLDFDI
jgi:hypothetical protein